MFFSLPASILNHDRGVNARGEMEMGHVIAVAGPIGGGKTSLVKALARVLKDASILFYDNYEQSSKGSVDEMIRWMRDGANIDNLDIARLAGDLSKLKSGQAIIDPLTLAEIPPNKLIILEMPLGREHKSAAPYIDLLIWIDTPPDIALARKIKEFTGHFLIEHRDAAGRDFVVWLHQYLDNYLRAIRDLLQIQRERVAPNADIILDGRCDLETMLKQALREISARMP
jgi:uridine kinase